LDCLAKLKAAGAQVPDVLPPLGAMVEVPAAALGVRALLAEADFLAIGTNDLAQYVLATDRNLGALSALYDPRHPALLRLIAGVAIAARRANKPLSVCGEIAGDPMAVPLLLALGIRELSMAPTRLAQARAAIEATHCAQLRALVPRLLRAGSRGELEALLCTLGNR
ncbi:phosphoenolpyruvate-protein phosphotransferase, partial [mine drainage metagenome]